MIRTLCSFILTTALLACQQSKTVKVTDEQLRDLQESGVTVVDVRTAREYEAGHVPGVTLNIDFLSEDFLEKMRALNNEEPVVIYCAKGGRSGRASVMLQEAGFQVIYDYDGGFSDWKSKGNEIEK